MLESFCREARLHRRRLVTEHRRVVPADIRPRANRAALGGIRRYVRRIPAELTVPLFRGLDGRIESLLHALRLRNQKLQGLSRDAALK